MFWKLTLSTFWFQLCWGLHAGGQYAINFFHLVAVLVPAKQFKVMAQDLVYSP